MENVPLLSSEEFRATFGERMERLDPTQFPPFEFWPYFDEIPVEDFCGYDCSDCKVEYVYCSGPGGFIHVLVNSDDPDVKMVVVLDLSWRKVAGHHLLKLRELYGLDG